MPISPLNKIKIPSTSVPISTKIGAGLEGIFNLEFDGSFKIMIYRFYVKLYRDVAAITPERAKEVIEEEMSDDWANFKDKFYNFLVKEGIADNEPEEIK